MVADCKVREVAVERGGHTRCSIVLLHARRTYTLYMYNVISRANFPSRSIDHARAIDVSERALILRL